MRQWTVDAFASEPFRGNPACVVEPFDAWPDDAWMQALAQENNQAETAYLLRTDADDRFGLRWFTPALEVPLCGHATLAAAHVLFGHLGLQAERIVFETRHRGVLTVVRDGAGYVMDLPADPPRRTPEPDGLAAALGARPVEVWAASYLVAVVENEAAVRSLQPNIAALGDIAGEATGGRGNLAVCAAASGQADVVDRFFAPGSGIPEDPATGSMHCILAPLYAEKLGRAKLRFHQAYPGRGADMVCETAGERVRITGQARTVVESRLLL